jgi:hypothetical protein
MIDWKPADTWPDNHFMTYLVWVERPDPSGLGLGLGPECCVFLACVCHDHKNLVPHPSGVGVDFPRVWEHHPSGRRFANDARVAHWAEFNRPVSTANPQPAILDDTHQLAREGYHAAANRPGDAGPDSPDDPPDA